jgi:hypothetical protein
VSHGLDTSGRDAEREGNLLSQDDRAGVGF